MIRRFVMAAVVAAIPVLLASSAMADVSASLVLRSGERITGNLVDLGGTGFTFRVNGQDRKYSVDQVARIEFQGNAPIPQDAQVRSGEHAFVLTNGQVVLGRLYDIGGRQPLTLTVDTSSGRRELRSNEVRTIHLVSPSSVGVATSGSTLAMPEGSGILVPANQQWTDTGILVRKGQRVRFNAQGEVQLSTDPKDRAIPQGSLTGRRPANGPLPQELAGALIGRVGTSTPFAVSNAAEIQMPETGHLSLGVNDDVVTDNQGGFRVEVTPLGRR